MKKFNIIWIIVLILLLLPTFTTAFTGSSPNYNLNRSSFAIIAHNATSPSYSSHTSANNLITGNATSSSYSNEIGYIHTLLKATAAAAGSNAPIVNFAYTLPRYVNLNDIFTIRANVTDADNDLVSVNFSLKDPTDSYTYQNVNGTSAGTYLWNSTSTTTANQYGTWTAYVNATDAQGNEAYNTTTFKVGLATKTVYEREENVSRFALWITDSLAKFNLSFISPDTESTFTFLVNKTISELYAEVSSILTTSDDQVAPTITRIYPSQFQNLPTGTKYTWINITTNENATCEYSVTPGFTYGTGTELTTLNNTYHYYNFTNGTQLYDGIIYLIHYKCNDTSGNTNTQSTMHYFKINRIEPNFTEYDPASTDSTNFTAIEDLYNVSNMRLAVSSKGRIKWKNIINAHEQDFDTFIEIGAKFISVNSTGLHSSLNSSSNITIEGVTCESFKPLTDLIYTTGDYSTKADIIANGKSCPPNICLNIDCQGTVLNFTAAHFTGYAAGGNANLSIYDDYENSNVSTSTNSTFYANYTNSTGELITDASCNITFEGDAGTTYQMTQDENNYYNYSKSFASAATYSWNVTCSATGYTTLTANDTILVTAAGNTAPPVPILSAPLSGNTTTNRTLTLYWNNATDSDGESINYTIHINSSSENVMNFNKSETANRSFFIVYEEELQTDIEYYWKVRAYDDEEYGEWSDTWNFTIESELLVSLPTSTIDFGTMLPDETANSSSANTPIIIQNAGNILMNITITGASIWSTQTNPTNYYRYWIEENETSSYDMGNGTDRQMQTSSSDIDIRNLNYSDTADDARLHVYIEVPTNEPSGIKNSAITITASG